jgi:hypothetical protein
LPLAHEVAQLALRELAVGDDATEMISTLPSISRTSRSAAGQVFHAAT